MRMAAICLLVACGGLPGCTTMRDDSRRTLDALDRNLTPSSPVARGLLLPVAIPVGLGGLVCDTVVVNPVCALDDAWLDTTDLLWTSRDESMLRRTLFTPVAALATPVVFGLDWLWRCLVPLAPRRELDERAAPSERPANVPPSAASEVGR
jgi:hypothetical protein